MSKFIFAANFKCNHTRRSFQEYAEILEQNLHEISALNLKTDPTQPPVCKNLNTKLNSANLLDEVMHFYLPNLALHKAHKISIRAKTEHSQVKSAHKIWLNLELIVY